MTASAITAAIEMEFAGVGAGWTNVSTDVSRAVGVRFGYGIRAGGFQDRVAQTGTLTFALDNSSTNSARKLGYYSPDHANKRTGFAIGIRVRLKITHSASTRYKFIGTLNEILPAPGAWASRLTSCTAVDWMDEAAKQKTANIATQVGKRADEIIAAIVANMTRQPVATSYAAAQLEYPYALDTAEDEQTSAMTELAKAVNSDLGYLYIKGDTSAGGKLTYEDRRVRQAANTVATALTDGAGLTGLQLTHGRDTVFNRVKVSINPRRVDADATTVLYQYDGAQLIALGPGESVTIIGQYRDPDQRAQRVGGVDLVTPVAGTDYAFGTGPGDTSLTADLTVTATAGGNSVIIQLTNGGSVSGFVTMVRVRGRGLYAYDPITLQAEDSTSKTAYGEFVLPVDLPHEPRQFVASSIASALLSRFKDPRSYVETVTIDANVSDAMMAAALDNEPGTLISITETATGLSASKYFINGVAGVTDGIRLRVTWYVTPKLDTATVFVLDSSVLNGTDVLGW